MQFNKGSGFTLVELMVVVAIVAILSALAVPNYMQYLLQSRRSDAMVAIYDIQARQQACYSLTQSYCTAINGTAQNSLGFSNAVSNITSPQNFYNISVNSIGQTSPQHYMINAAVNTQMGQNADTECATIGMDDYGNRYGWNSTNQVVTDCWQ